MSAHTPGPWSWGSGWDEWSIEEEGGDFDSDQKYLDLELRGGNGAVILPLRIDHYHLEVDHAGKDSFLSPADRALIKAAPKMLKALRDFVEWGAMTGSDRDMFVRRFRDVISEAESK